MKPAMLNHPDYGNVFGVEIGPGDLGNWSPTVAQMRDVALRRWVTGPNFAPWCGEKQALAESFAPHQREVETISEMTCDAVRAGRLIDFGFWPNEAIKFGGTRGGPLWSRGFIGQPFMDPWVLYHTWEGLPGIYLVNPKGDKPTGNSFEICELQPATAKGDPMLTIADRGTFIFPETPFTDWRKYGAHLAPSTARYLPGAEDTLNNGKDPAGAAAGNIGDPVMLAMLILNTRNVERETIRASDKLQRARAKSNKPPIPSYDRVHSAAYVTAITNRAKSRRGESLGGTHASPVPHIRMGHPREYASGRTIFIRDTLVNANETARAEFARQGYVVRPQP